MKKASPSQRKMMPLVSQIIDEERTDSPAATTLLFHETLDDSFEVTNA